MARHLASDDNGAIWLVQHRLPVHYLALAGARHAPSSADGPQNGTAGAYGALHSSAESPHPFSLLRTFSATCLIWPTLISRLQR